MDPQSQIINVYEVDHKFSPGVGIFDLTFMVPEGAIFGLIGPSGCGKTTTVRLLTGLYKPGKGILRVMGRTPYKFTTRERELIGYMPQQFVLYPNLTVSENLLFVASMYGVGYFTRHRRLKELLEFVELTDARKRLGRHLSGGMQRRLELACALVHNPKLLFADEPTAGIDPMLREKFWQHFRDLRDQGHTIFVTTQYISEAAYCDWVGVMRNGRMLHLNTPDGLRRQAFPNEVIKVTVDRRQVAKAIRVFHRLTMVKRVHGLDQEPGSIHVHVDDAGAVIPRLFQALSKHPEIVIRKIEEYKPPFEEIFITLMKRAEQSHG